MTEEDEEDEEDKNKLQRFFEKRRTNQKEIVAHNNSFTL